MDHLQQPANLGQVFACLTPTFVTAPEGAYISLAFGTEVERHWLLERERPLTIGRHADCGICLPDRRVSSRHAQIRWADGHYLLTDLNSKNGTYINGRRITAPTPLHNGDAFQIAFCFALLFVDASEA